MAAIKKGDSVKVLSGKAKGDTGAVLKVLKADNKVIVEGVNIVKKHQKPSQENQTGGIVELEAPIHISNVALAKGGK